GSSAGRARPPPYLSTQTMLERGITRDAWNPANRGTTFPVESGPSEVWPAAIRGIPRRTIRAIAAHIHNSRCAWVKTLGQEHGVVAPARVDRNKVQRKQLVAALGRSGEAMGRLLRLGCDHDGHVPPSRGYVWRN